MAMPQEISQHVRDLQPGQLVPGKGILIGEFDLADSRGRKLSIRTRWYDTATELGRPMTFDKTAETVASFNGNGRGGLRLDASRYEAELFEKLKTGEAMGKNVVAPLEVVRAIYELRNRGEYKRISASDLPGKLITIASGTDDAHWQWSCAPFRDHPAFVRAVVFSDGDILSGGDLVWLQRANFRLSGRSCFAELAL